MPSNRTVCASQAASRATAYVRGGVRADERKTVDAAQVSAEREIVAADVHQLVRQCLPFGGRPGFDRRRGYSTAGVKTLATCGVVTSAGAGDPASV
jgi:hypothetical protein